MIRWISTPHGGARMGKYMGKHLWNLKDMAHMAHMAWPPWDFLGTLICNLQACSEALWLWTCADALWVVLQPRQCNDEFGVFLPVRWEFPSSQVGVFFSQQNLISHFQPQASSHCAKMLGMKSQVLGPCSGQALPPTWPQPQFNVCNRAGPWCLDMPCAIKKGTWALCKTEVWRDRHKLRPSQGVLDLAIVYDPLF